MATPGILYVTMQPKPGLPLEQFHDWYNNEHGPTRLRLPHVFNNGFRYRATDDRDPEYVAIYDVTSMPLLATDTYTALRANRSSREAEIISHIQVNRFFYDLIYTKESTEFVPFDKLSEQEVEGIQTTAVEMLLVDGKSSEEEYGKWLIEEHIELLSKVPGWLRSRYFKTSSVEPHLAETYLCLHDYRKENGQGGKEHKASMDTPRRTRIFDKYVTSKGRRTWSLFYTFGPAPRDLSALAKPSKAIPFTSPDSKTTTTPAEEAVINSYVTAGDGLELRYRLEGNSEPHAPTLAFCNSLLTSLDMWEPFVKILKQARPDLRILRYDSRGRHPLPQPPVAATLGKLADDIRTLLDALRISKLHTLIGVSMGGATTLEFALKYPERLHKFITCDIGIASSAASTQAWKDRIAIAEENNGKGISTLAQKTVARWFHPATMNNKPDTVKWMTDIAAANDVEGFKYSCQALWDYHLEPRLRGCTVPGRLVVGEADAGGAMLKMMEGYKDLLGEKGTELKILPNLGHLPMCENPEAFWKVVEDFI
ncbi:hypothetical protein G7046_g4858 [Stylonectria norvegica]|nr:hypothetical protein G7046_g4858 [Stylonectria norvegica]